jgi:hypothetical protein
MWYKTTFPKKEFNWLADDVVIIHNIDIRSISGTCGDAFAIHVIKKGYKDVSSRSLTIYINSKSDISDHRAFTEEDFKTKFPNVIPKYQK